MTAQVLEIHKESDLVLQVQATDLPSGVTLSAPTVQAQKRTPKSDPQDWNVAAGVTINTISVVDRVDLTRLPAIVSLAAGQAVRFIWRADPDALPDETDEPTPGDNYRVVVTATRSDGLGDWVAKPSVRIHP